MLHCVQLSGQDDPRRNAAVPVEPLEAIPDEQVLLKAMRLVEGVATPHNGNSDHDHRRSTMRVPQTLRFTAR